MSQSGNLLESLTAACDPGTPTYLLIDPMGGEPLQLVTSELASEPACQLAREQAWHRPIYRIALDSSIELPSHLHPYLVGLNGATDPWMAASLEMAIDEHEAARAEGLAGTGTALTRIGGWLSSGHQPEQVASSLGRLMKAPPGGPNGVRYLRIGDRRVLEWLASVIGSARLSATCGLVQQWAYLDTLGGLSKLDLSADRAAELRLEPREWQEVMLGSLIHPTMARWLGQALKAPDAAYADCPHEPRQALAAAAAAVRHAQLASKRWPKHFEASVDLTAWAAITLLHPRIQQPGALVDLMSQLPSTERDGPAVHAHCRSLDHLCKAAMSDLSRTSASR